MNLRNNLYYPLASLSIALLLAVSACQGSQTSEQTSQWSELLKGAAIESYLSVKLHDHQRYNRVHQSSKVSINEGSFEIGGASFNVSSETFEFDGGELELMVTIECTSGELEQASFSLDFEFTDWSFDNYVLMPGLLYDGNRDFQIFKSPGWFPWLADSRYVGPNTGPFATDIPRLAGEHMRGVPAIQVMSGHLTNPSLGVFSPASGQGLFILTEQGTELGDNGLSLEEYRDSTGALFSITAPVVRERTQYRHMTSSAPSSDKAPTISQGQKFTISCRLLFFDADKPQDLFDKYVSIRGSQTGEAVLSINYPYSNAFQILEKKFNKYQWVEEPGYYKFRPKFWLYDFQIGWMGGAIFTYPLLHSGGQQSKDRVVKMLDWLFDDFKAPSGYFWDTANKGKNFSGIYPHVAYGDSVTLTRNNGDGLYYSIRHFETLKQQGVLVKGSWERSAYDVAEAFSDTWHRFGQLGQYINLYTGDVVVGNSSGGAIVPAAMVLAAEYYNDSDLLSVAEEMGEHFYQNYTTKGIAYGAPGDALSAPDSESSFALVESFVLLYEATQKEIWLTRAMEAANQFSTWVYSYNYDFPDSSLFGRLDIKTVGAVSANAQNGPGTPAICTYSGLSLLNLSRYSGRPVYAEILRDIAHNIPQYLSHPERMINPDHEGWMSERVVTADWAEDIGEISYHSTWPEVALALSVIELPGVYANPETKQVLCFDNMEAAFVTDDAGQLSLNISNPTNFKAEVKVFVEEEGQKNPIGAFSDFKLVRLEPGEQKTIALE